MRPNPADFQPLGPDNILSWVHFGDLHLTTEAGRNYQNLEKLIAAANDHLTVCGVNFALLPGDNADNGTVGQYALLVRALDKLKLPLHVLPGDHDIQSGNLNAFKSFLEPWLPKCFVAGRRRCVFLNSVDIVGSEGFGFMAPQLEYLRQQLQAAADLGERVVLFMHNYPSELTRTDPTGAVTALIDNSGAVRVVEMGHTHYNEIANDGKVIYAATRSTGQIEEGPVGFSVTCLDGDVVSWKFKELASPWPFVMITSPADEKFQTRFTTPAWQPGQIRVKAWAEGGTVNAWCRVGQTKYQPMTPGGDGASWSTDWDPGQLPDGVYPVTVWAVDQRGESAGDTVNVRIDRAGRHPVRPPQSPDMNNRIGPYPARGISGTLLGPNAHGHPW